MYRTTELTGDVYFHASEPYVYGEGDEQIVVTLLRSAAFAARAVP